MYEVLSSFFSFFLFFNLKGSWLQDTLKIVEFAWNRRFFYLPGACSPFFG